MARRPSLFLSLVFLSAFCGSSAEAQTLEGFAKLPADTFAPGPTSGQFITGNTNGRVPPFVDKQPLQGVSSVLAGPRNDFWVMPDNGFGAKDNSADYVLRLFRIAPHFKTKHGESGTINYPFSAGRVPGQPDPNEFIILGLDQPLTPCHRDGHRLEDDRLGR